METDTSHVATSSYPIPASEALSPTIKTLFDTIITVNEVEVQKESFKRFSNYLEKAEFMLKELAKQTVSCPERLENAIQILNREIEESKELASECRRRNKIYLLLNSRKILKCLQERTKEIGRALTLLAVLEDLEWMKQREDMLELGKVMLDAEFQVAAAEHEILMKLKCRTREQIGNSSNADSLMVQIADAIGTSAKHSVLKQEFKEFKKEIEDAEVRKNMEEELPVEQIVPFLEKAEIMLSYEDKEKKYLEKKSTLSRLPLKPLDSFFCPITLDIMADPVDVSSGKTFDRSAIEGWFASGNKTCPLTGVLLQSFVLRPNRTLRRLIEEWKEWNVMVNISSIKEKLQLKNEDEVLECLEKLRTVCMEREQYREWIVFENYIPVLVEILATKNRKIRELSLAILQILAKDSNENKEKICKSNMALEFTVRSLSRQIEESTLAVQLLVELSKCSPVLEVIGNIQGCIFYLVTMSLEEDKQIAASARELLEKLSSRYENVIQMAKANYFKPLLSLLSSGPEDVQIIMARTLSEIDLTERQKLSLVNNGALRPLLQILSHGNLEMKTVTAKALQHLSSLPTNGLQMIRDGAVAPLFEILYQHSLSSPALRKHVSATIMHIALSASSKEADMQCASLFKSDDDIFKLFCLVSLTGPEVQESILQTFHAMCTSPNGSDIIVKLRQLSALQVLVQLCVVDNLIVRANAVKLFHCLTEDESNDTIVLEHVGQRCLASLLKIVETSNDMEEVVAAMGIISNLPPDTQITQWLLDAGLLEVIAATLADGNRNQLHKTSLTENAARALCRFTVSTNREWQKKVAAADIIPILVKLLVSGAAPVKRYAGISLKQFSESSSELSKPVKNGNFCCCLTSPEISCPVHLGICTVKSSFCIIEANALEPLVRLLGDPDSGVCEASLDALLTLINGERIQSGSKVLAEVNAIQPIIKLLSSPSLSLQEKSLMALEKMFRLVDFKQKFATSAHMPLVEITQKGGIRMKSMAARALAQLDVLQDQSSYF